MAIQWTAPNSVFDGFVVTAEPIDAGLLVGEPGTPTGYQGVYICIVVCYIL